MESESDHRCGLDGKQLLGGGGVGLNTDAAQRVIGTRTWRWSRVSGGVHLDNFGRRRWDIGSESPLARPNQHLRFRQRLHPRSMSHAPSPFSTAVSGGGLLQPIVPESRTAYVQLVLPQLPVQSLPGWVGPAEQTATGTERSFGGCGSRSQNNANTSVGAGHDAATMDDNLTSYTRRQPPSFPHYPISQTTPTPCLASFGNGLHQVVARQLSQVPVRCSYCHTFRTC